MRLARSLLLVFAAVLVTCLVIERAFSLHAPERPLVIASAWEHGQLLGRVDVEHESDPRVAELRRTHPTAEVVFESVDGSGPILTSTESLFAMSLVPGHDGVEITLAGSTTYVTPDDLLARQAYNHGVTFPSLMMGIGTDVQVVLALAAERLHSSARELLDHARIRRIRVTRSRPDHPSGPRVSPSDVTPNLVREAALEAARYLARGVDARGRFRYLGDAPTNRTIAGYDWPRHAGATYFLAQAASVAQRAAPSRRVVPDAVGASDGEPELTYAALRAAALLRDEALVPCGDARCIAVENVAEIGSTALATVAFAEIARSGLDASYRPLVLELARFLRSQQRPDGEFMHLYDRRARRPIDVQLLYFSGEATLALARAQSLGGPEAAASRDAAARGLANLVGPAWRFFGDRYYYGEEHWTCQALDDLWDVAPNPDALNFCVRWARYNRSIMHEDGDSPHDADGSLGIDPILSPRLTPVASRCEAAVATLRVVNRATTGVASEAERRAIEGQLRRAFAFLLRFQFRAEGSTPTHLFADPAAVSGAVPGSPVDWQLRIDYAQHAGSAMIRWLE